MYTNSCTQTAGATSPASGSCAFQMPAATGTYQFRLFTNDTFTVLFRRGTPRRKPAKPVALGLAA